MKQVTAIIIVLVIIVGGYFILGANEPSAGDTVTKSGTVTEVSLEQMAVDGPALLTIQDKNDQIHTIAIPSMGILLCDAKDNIADVTIAALGDYVEVRGELNEEGHIIPCENSEHYLILDGSMKDEVLGFQFDYRKGPDGYITFEDNESTDSNYVTGIVLFNKKEYDAFKTSTDAREGPPAIHVRIYQNDDNLHPSVWALQNPRESNIELALGEPQESTVGGANAIFYTVDGLYPIDTYIVASGEHVYVLMGSYLSTEDAIYHDFKDLVESFTFIPGPADSPEAKIDIRIACESALAYMTFSSGAEADAFVESCIRGKHPEVINRYIEDLDLDGASV